jgi:hypothetical protein
MKQIVHFRSLHLVFKGEVFEVTASLRAVADDESPDCVVVCDVCFKIRLVHTSVHTSYNVM